MSHALLLYHYIGSFTQVSVTKRSNPCQIKIENKIINIEMSLNVCSLVKRNILRTRLVQHVTRQ